MHEQEGVKPTRRHRHHGRCALVVAAAFLGACASDRRAARDESAERIEDIIGPGAASEPIPEGIALGPDAPPLSGAPEEEPLALLEVPEETGASPRPWSAPVTPCSAPPHGAILPAPVPLACLLHPGAFEYRITPRPGGSIPGLLP
jgi:hypothetical protein